MTSRLAQMIHLIILRYIHKVKVASDCIINGTPHIHNRGEFIIKPNVRINSSRKSNPIGGDTRCTFVIAPHAKLEMGEGTRLSNSAIVCRQEVRIGKHVFIGGNCKIYDTDFHPVSFSQRIAEDKQLAVVKPVKIQDGAFIGTGCLILKGVTIGRKSVIGARSVVTKSVPQHQIWAGNPAKFIRRLTKQEIQ